IQQLTPILLKALSSPNKYTDDALVALLKTAFVHYLDASSLALVMPILQRGLKERAAGTKKRAAQTLNGLISVVEPKELIPYLERLIPNLREVLVDPVPGTRATAAKCLGTFVEKLGEQNFPNLIDNLLEVLSSDASGVDRQGAAQGLSEVLSGLGLDRLNEVLPEILRNTSHPKEYVREGYISLLIYLPATFGPRFQPYLARIIPPVLSGLADESRDVSDQSLRAAKMIVANYAFKSVDLLLPELERGLFDDNWRIRQSSVQLIGDLLFKITGINTKTDIDLAEDDDAGVTETQKTALLDILGKERRDRLLAALYITRQDSSGLVRLSALHVWKAMVSNTPRMVKEVLPAMTSIIITNLASSNEEHRTVAAQTLGDIVRKLGESVLAQLVPVLQSDLESTEAAMRMGVCSALTEIMASCGQHQIEEYETEFIAAVRMALVDTDVSVRLAAARSFDSLQETFGDRVIDQILPDLLRALQSDQTAATALAALKEIMSMRANAIFPVLIPSLTEIPISLFNAKALASLAEVAGSAFTRRFKKIIHALVDTILQTKDQETRIEIENSLHQVTTSIIDSSDLLNLMPVLLGLAKHEDYRKRVLGCEQLGYFVEYTKVDYFTYVPELVQVLVTSLSDETCMTEASVALTAFVKTSRKVALDAAVIPVFNALQYTGYPGKELPGFCKIPKGINAVLPIFVQGLTGGTPEQREKAAAGMGAIIVRSNAESTKPFMAQITGPLIRVMGERTKREIKIEILSSLNLLMKQVNIQLKPFFPQLQRTFTKALADPDNSTLRTNAADALSTLVAMQTRVDPLIAELALGATNPDPGVKLAMYKAMKEVIARAGHLLSDGSQKTVWKLFEEGCENSDDRIVIQSARLLGSLMKQSIPSDSDIIRSKILSRHDSHSAILGLNAVLAEAPEKLTELHLTSNVILYILEELKSSQPPISNNSVLAAGKLLLSEKLSIGFSSTKALLTGLAETIEQVSSGNTDNKRLALVVIKTVSRLRFDMIKPHIAFLAPTVFTCVREIIIPVKLAAEQAYIAMFELVKNGPALFEKFLQNEELGPRSKAMKEYMDRVAMRLAALESERLADGGDHIGLDQLEDEHEIWQVGGFETDWTSE
ncbi:Translational activator gcn1, partial [Neolecta irregularis DAH-3]